MTNLIGKKLKWTAWRTVNGTGAHVEQRGVIVAVAFDQGTWSLLVERDTGGFEGVDPERENVSIQAS